METIFSHQCAATTPYAARSTAQTGPRSQRGFTYVELIAVMVLIGLLSATAYSRLGNNGYDAAGFRDQVGATLAFARKAAIAQRRCVRVSINGNALEFRIANDVPETMARCTGFNLAASRNLVLPGAGDARIAPQGASTLTGPGVLLFTPLGTTSDRAANYVYVIGGATGHSVTVDAESGHVY